jgi:small subunit ribosomal protein S12e
MAEKAPAPVEEVTVDPFTATLKRVIQTSNANALLAKGIHEVCKALESKEEKLKPKFVVLSKNCTDDAYVKLVKALAKQNKVPLITVDQGEILGEWLGICKYDKQKNVRKKRKCSSLAIKEYPVEIKEEEKKIIQEKLTLA